jgi:HEAT repeat protein
MPPSKAFSAVLDHLQDTSKPFPAIDLYHFSNLSPGNLAALEAAWPDVPVERRRGIMQDLSDLSEANFEVSFEPVFRLGLEDDDAEVRATAINSLWESEEPDLIAPFIDFMQHDPDANVRAAAASALGRFVYLGELDELPEAQRGRIEDVLLAAAQGNDELDVRRRALEAVAFSSRPEVAPLISKAYADPETKWRESAVFAMGRSADERWAEPVCAEMRSTLPEMRFEAARAAGELELEDAVPGLIELTRDVDEQVRDAAIWSLSQVGGPEARRALTRLLRRADDDERDYLQDALDNLDFTEEVQDLAMFVLDEEGDELDDADEEDDEDIHKSRLN